MRWLLTILFLTGSHFAAYGLGAYRGDRPRGHGSRWFFAGVVVCLVALWLVIFLLL